MLNLFVDGENFRIKLSWKGEEPPGEEELKKVFAKLREEIQWAESEDLEDIDLDKTDQKTFDKVRSFQEKRAGRK